MSDKISDVIQNWYKDVSLNFDLKAIDRLPSDLSKFKTDTRHIEEGDVFIPIVGEKFDGHDFLKEALSKKAAFILCNETLTHKTSQDMLKNCILVKDTIDAYLSLAGHYRQSLKETKFIAITGSNGKTTTKDMCYEALNGYLPTYKTEKNFNNEIGVAMSVLAVKPFHKFAVIEMGARHIGDIRRLIEKVKPDVNCILNIGDAHIGEFGSYENLFQAKMEMFNYAKTDAILIGPADDEKIQNRLKELPNHRLSFGIKGDVSILDIDFSNPELIQYTFLLPSNEKVKAELNFYHEACKINLATVVAIILSLNIPFSKSLSSLKNYSPAEGRFNRIIHTNETIVDDSYNANPKSMKLGLESIEKIYPKMNKILVLGDMLELGQYTEVEHQKLGHLVNDLSSVLKVISVGKYSKQMEKSLNKSTYHKHYSSIEEAILDFDHIFDLKEPTVIYLKGSNSMKLNKLLALFGQNKP